MQVGDVLSISGSMKRMNTLLEQINRQAVCTFLEHRGILYSRMSSSCRPQCVFSPIAIIFFFTDMSLYQTPHAASSKHLDMRFKNKNKKYASTMISYSMVIQWLPKTKHLLSRISKK